MFKKRKWLFCLILILIHSLALPCGQVFAEQADSVDLGLTAKSAVLMEADTGTIIYEKNSHESLPPASVTKVMTLLLIYEAVEDGKMKWEDMVSVSEHASSMGGSQVYLEPMEQQTVRDMTKCIAIASANDAAVAMAEYIGGSEEAFVDKMNEKAKELGMEDTHFVNACGLDADGHVTSANDIAVMSRELITKYPEVTEFTKTWQDSIIHKTKRGESEFGLTNTNKLLKWYDGATGLKTGSTGKALYCLSGTAEKNGLKLIGVVMAAPDYKTRFEEVMQMFDYGFANYGITKGLPAGEEVALIPVTKGEKEEVTLVVDKEVSFLAKKGSESSMESETQLSPYLKAPFEAGTKGGVVIYKVDGQEIGRSELVTKEAVGKITLGTMFEKMLSQWF